MSQLINILSQYNLFSQPYRLYAASQIYSSGKGLDEECSEGFPRNRSENSSILSTYQAHIRTIKSLFNGNSTKYHSLCSTLFLSSGYGKLRLVSAVGIPPRPR